MAACAVLACGMLLGGCRASPGYQGSQRDILANYRFRRLTATLPRDVRVPAVIAAAKAALQGRGYAIRESATTEDHGEISAEPADPGVLESITLTARQTASGPEIRIISEPLGDQQRSHIILDAVLTQLGL